MKEKFIWFFLITLTFAMLTSGCGKDDDDENAEDSYQIYYSNSDETELVGVSYGAKSKSKQELVYELLDKMDEEPDSLKYKKIKDDSIEVSSINLGDSGQLTLHFNSAYTNLSGIREILYRASVVKTLCQIDGVDSVEFYVDDQPLMESADKAVGFQTSDDFIDNTGENTNFYQDITLNLYFANEEGSKLVEVPVTVKYDGSVSMEELILERLVEGPESIDGVDSESVKRTISEETKVTKTSIREGVCYVYLNSAFLDKVPDITDEVAVYSIVNSLCEVSTIDKVQFIIDGETVTTYREDIELDVTLERNLDLVENGNQ